jgi:hypothetical protein
MVFKNNDVDKNAQLLKELVNDGYCSLFFMDTNTNKTSGAPFCKKRCEENIENTAVLVDHSQKYTDWQQEALPGITIA